MRESIASLIPFYLNQTLSPEEMKAVEAALLEDADLREEFFHWMGVRQDLRSIDRACAAGRPPADPARLLPKLKKRTTIYIPFRKASARYLRFPAWVWQPAVVLIVALQLLALGLFVAGIHVEKRGGFRVMSAPREGAAVVQAYNVIFQPEATEQQIRALMLSYRAQFVEGPNRIGLYRIRIVQPSPEKLEQFPKEPIVRFMERNL